MDNTQWNKLFCAFFDAEQRGMEIPFCAKTSIGEFTRRDTAWEHFGAEWKNFSDYECIEIFLTPDNRAFVLGTLQELGLPCTLKGGRAVVCARPVPGVHEPWAGGR
jgi:hypothetical protein